MWIYDNTIANRDTIVFTTIATIHTITMFVAIVPFEGKEKTRFEDKLYTVLFSY